RQVGDLFADLLDRAPGLGLDIAPGLLHRLVALGLGLLLRLALVPVRRLPGPGDDLVGLAACLLEPLAVVGEELFGLLARLLGGVDRLVDLPRAGVERVTQPRVDSLAADVER